MIVVDKLQTGFDEQRLHTLFLDKEIRSINAIQTISRVNRTCKYKNECHIIDLSHNNVNVKNIREAFSQFSNLVISDFDPMGLRSRLETIFKQLNLHLLFKRWFNKYKKHLTSGKANVDFILEIENDFRRWIKDAIERKAQEDKQSEEGELSDSTCAVENDALQLKRQINEYLNLLSLLNGTIDIDSKMLAPDFIDFWQRYTNIYNSLNPIGTSTEMDIIVS